MSDQLVFSTRKALVNYFYTSFDVNSAKFFCYLPLKLELLLRQ